MKRALMILGVCGLTMFLATSAFAAILPIGGAFSSSIGSWAQQFNESGVGTFNQGGIWSLSGDIFEAPGFSNASSTDWFSDAPSASYAYAFGPSTTSLDFNINFNGSSSSSLSFLFMASQDMDVREWAYASWNGSSWSIRAATDTETAGKGPIDPSAIPEPATMSLLGLGLLGIFGLKKGRKNYA
jgi:hypothetical protein